MDIIVEMDQTEAYLTQLLQIMQQEDSGFTAKEFEKRFRISEWKRKRLFEFAIENGYLKSYLGKRKYANGVVNVITLYSWTDKAYANFAKTA